MTSSSPARLRTRRIGIAVAATALVAAGLTPLTGGAAAASPPSAPVVVGPSDATPVLKEVVLDWDASQGAGSYVVQVGTDERWSDDPTLELTTIGTRLTLPGSLPHASYVWRVAAVGPDGQGRWSGNGTFTRGWGAASTPLAPFGQVAQTDGVPTFRWSPVATASEYQLQVSTSQFFDAPFRSQSDVVTESCFTTRTAITPFNGQAQAKNNGVGDCFFSLLGTGENRFWRVRPLDHVVDDAGEVNTTPVVDEGISSQPPAKMNELDTTACPAPPGTAASPKASAAPAASASPAPSASASAVPGPTPTASAAPETAGGCEPANTVEKGPWSNAASFNHLFPAAPRPVPNYRDLAEVGRPTLSTDVCRDAVCRDFPTVSWSAVPGAEWYRLYVALDATYTNIHEIIETPGLTWTPTAQWRDSTAGASYYVIVQPCTTSRTAPEPGFTTGRSPGCDEPSAPAVFRKTSPKLATTKPDDATLLAGGEVLFSWQSASEALSAAIGGPATSEAYAYRFQLTTAANPDFLAKGLVENVLVDSTHHVSTDKAYPDGGYLWRVQTLDASGHALPWSTVRSFVRDQTAPTFSVTPTAKLAVDGAVRVGFSEPVVGVDASSVSMGAPAIVAASADGRSVTLTPTGHLIPGATYPVEVTAAVRDRAGNAAVRRVVPVSVDPVVDDRSPAMGLGGAWSRLAASNAFAGTFSRSIPTSSRQTAATVALQGRGAEVKGCVGPANGVVELWADGIRLTRIDTYRSFSGCGVVLTRAPFHSGAGFHRIQVRGIGVKNGKSTGTAISIDAITAVR